MYWQGLPLLSTTRHNTAHVVTNAL